MVERSVLKLLMDEGMDTTLITSKQYSSMSMQDLEICVGPMVEVGMTLSRVSVPLGNGMDRHEEALEGAKSSCREEEQVH